MSYEFLRWFTCEGYTPSVSVECDKSSSSQKDLQQRRIPICFNSEEVLVEQKDQVESRSQRKLDNIGKETTATEAVSGKERGIGRDENTHTRTCTDTLTCIGKCKATEKSTSTRCSAVSKRVRNTSKNSETQQQHTVEHKFLETPTVSNAQESKGATAFRLPVLPSAVPDRKFRDRSDNTPCLSAVSSASWSPSASCSNAGQDDTALTVLSSQLLDKATLKESPMTETATTSPASTTATTISLFLPLHAHAANEEAIRLRCRDVDSPVVLTNVDIIQASNQDCTRGKAPVFVRTEDGSDGVYIRVRAVVSLFRDTIDSGGYLLTGPRAIVPTTSSAAKVSAPALLGIVLPTALLFSMCYAYLATKTSGLQSIFPSPATTGLVIKLTTWFCVLTLVVYEHWWFWTTTPGRWALGADRVMSTEFELTVLGWASEMKKNENGVVENGIMSRGLQGSVNLERSHQESVADSSIAASELQLENPHSPENDDALAEKSCSLEDGPLKAAVKQPSLSESCPGLKGTGKGSMKDPEPSDNDLSLQAKAPEPSENDPELSALSSPAAPDAEEVPLRFIKAEKGDIAAARARYKDTLAWRKKMGMDNILTEPHPNVFLIKENYPHYYHLRGRNNEPCYYERPSGMKLEPLKAAGLSMDDLMRHYALTCEFIWTYICPSEEGKSIYVIDMDGFGIRDFAGEVVDFSKKCSAFTAAHYPERSGSIFVINVPSWFSIIWNTVKTWIDEVTRKKINIIRSGSRDAITNALLEKIPLENIPPEYGGNSMPLGHSPEEIMFRELMKKNNERAQPTCSES